MLGRDSSRWPRSRRLLGKSGESWSIASLSGRWAARSLRCRRARADSGSFSAKWSAGAAPRVPRQFPGAQLAKMHIHAEESAHLSEQPRRGPKGFPQAAPKELAGCRPLSPVPLHKPPQDTQVRQLEPFRSKADVTKAGQI